MCGSPDQLTKEGLYGNSLLLLLFDYFSRQIKKIAPILNSQKTSEF